MSDKKGFTLVEIIAVLVIIAILSTIAIPNYITYTQQGAAKAAQNNLITIYNAEKNYYFNNGSYCIAGCDTLSDINLPANLNLNITDNNFSYTCTNAAGFTCRAANLSNNSFTLTVTGGTANNPTPIVLPGAAGSPNPSCTDAANPTYCPS